MAKKKESTQNLPGRIPVEELEIGGVYKTIVQELVKVEKINGGTKQIVLYNLTGAHRQWIDFKHVYLIEKIRQTR